MLPVHLPFDLFVEYLNDEVVLCTECGELFVHEPDDYAEIPCTACGEAAACALTLAQYERYLVVHTEFSND